MWYRKAQSYLGQGKDYTINTNNRTVQDVLKNFINGSQPVFFHDDKGQNYLIIHGSPAQDGQMYFDAGTDGSLSQEQLPAWMQSKGFDSAATKIIACHGGQVMSLDQSGGQLTPAFTNTGELQVSVPEDGSGEALNINAA